MNHAANPARVAYVVKRYPKFSETFIVNEILQHEAAGLALDIFSLRPVRDSHFQDALAAVQAPVTYLDDQASKAANLWEGLSSARRRLPDFWRRVDELDNIPVQDLMQGIALALEVHARQVTHLHAHFGTVAATVTRIAAHLAKRPYSLTLHAKDIYHSSVDSERLNRLIGDASAVVTVSDYNLDHLVRSCPSAAGKVRRIYNGLNMSRFPYLDGPADSREILAVGRLVEKKGFDVLIDACALLRSRGVEFSCRIIGDGAERSALEAKVAHHLLGGQVELAGPRPHAMLIREFRTAAVLAAPCMVGGDGDRDGLPTVLLEAMALGTACVSTPVTGIPELLRHDESGLMVAERDPDQLADALQSLLEQPELRIRLARNARHRVVQDFDSAQNSAELRALFGCGAASGSATLRRVC